MKLKSLIKSNSVFLFFLLFSSISINLYSQDIDINKKLIEFGTGLCMNLGYPSKAFKKDYEAKIIVKFDLYASGKIENITVVNPYIHLFKESLISGILASNGVWFKSVAKDSILKTVHIEVNYEFLDEPTKTAEMYYTEGLAWFNDGNLKKSKDLFLRSVMKNPYNDEYKSALVKCLSTDEKDIELSHILDLDLKNIDVDINLKVTGYKGKPSHAITVKTTEGLIGNLSFPEIEFYDSLWANGNSDGACYYRKFNNHSLYKYHGVVSDYYKENGQLLSTSSYDKGKLYGRYHEYFKNGNKKITGGFINNDITGTWTFFNSSGELEFKFKVYDDKVKFIKYKDTKSHSFHFQYTFVSPYNDNREFIVEGEVVDGFQNGKWLLFNKGEVIQEDYFENGQYTHSVIKGKQHNGTRFINKDIFMPYHLGKLERDKEDKALKNLY